MILKIWINHLKTLFFSAIKTLPISVLLIFVLTLISYMRINSVVINSSLNSLTLIFLILFVVYKIMNRYYESNKKNKLKVVNLIYLIGINITVIAVYGMFGLFLKAELYNLLGFVIGIALFCIDFMIFPLLNRKVKLIFKYVKYIFAKKKMKLFVFIFALIVLLIAVFLMTAIITIPLFILPFFRASLQIVVEIYCVVILVTSLSITMYNTRKVHIADFI